MSEMVVDALLITLKIAATSTVLMMLPAIAVGYVLARYNFWGKNFISSLVGLPLVLPPTAIGYILLAMFAIDGPLGEEILGIDIEILFTWKAAVVATSVVAFPLVIRTTRVAFENVDSNLEIMARTLGFNWWGSFIRITLPLAAKTLTAAAILGFTRVIGEFGATMIVAGIIPGKTQSLASAIFTAQQTGNSSDANILLIIALVVGIVAIYSSEYLSQKRSIGNN